VFVSDSLDTAIYQIKDNKASVFVKGPEFESPNGLLYHNGKLFVASWGLTTDWSTKKPGRLYSIDLKTKKRTYITKKPLGNLDGLEFAGSGNYLVSDWVAGKVYKINKKGVASVVASGFKGAADIAFVLKKKLLIVPRMQENIVTAFSLR